MRSAFAVFILFGISNAYAMVDYGIDLGGALIGVRSACIGVSDELDKMKTMAGIGTAVSGVGTVTGAVAIASGAKSVKAIDEIQHTKTQIQNLENELKKLEDEKTAASAKSEATEGAWRTTYLEYKNSEEFEARDKAVLIQKAAKQELEGSKQKQDFDEAARKLREAEAAVETAQQALKDTKGYKALGPALAADYEADKELEGAKQKYSQAVADAKTKQKPELEKQATQAAAQATKSGNLRTGMLAGTTATNVAGAVMAGSNRGRVNGTLGEMVDGCVDAVKVLSNVYGQARITSPTDANLKRAERVIRACRDWETVNLDPIRNRATGAMVSNIVGAGTGAVGTIVSAVSVSKEDLERAQKLGKTANTMAGVATVASGVATIFNASQIGAIKRASLVADVCRDALSGVGE